MRTQIMSQKYRKKWKNSYLIRLLRNKTSYQQAQRTEEIQYSWRLNNAPSNKEWITKEIKNS